MDPHNFDVIFSHYTNAKKGQARALTDTAKRLYKKLADKYQAELEAMGGIVDPESMRSMSIMKPDGTPLEQTAFWCRPLTADELSHLMRLNAVEALRSNYEVREFTACDERPCALCKSPCTMMLAVDHDKTTSFVCHACSDSSPFKKK
jgi:hypothetical protein